MTPIQLLIATRNRDKVREIADILTFHPFSFFSIHDFPDMPDVEEDQDTLLGNAVKKAMKLHIRYGLPALADDTGLEVDALNGAPGIFSARFAGNNATYQNNVAKLLHEMRLVSEGQRTARFRTVMALVHEGKVQTVEGVCAGEIFTEQRGEGGFGYDPVFYYPPLAKTFAELSLAEKNEISHRALALQKMIGVLKMVFGA